jgi:hypothetical protein
MVQRERRAAAPADGGADGDANLCKICLESVRRKPLLSCPVPF